MQPQLAPSKFAPSAGEVAEYVMAMAAELAVMARQAGLPALARSLEETKSAAGIAMGERQLGNAAPDDAA